MVISIVYYPIVHLKLCKLVFNLLFLSTIQKKFLNQIDLQLQTQHGTTSRLNKG